jgi:hypothetical protein
LKNEKTGGRKERKAEGPELGADEGCRGLHPRHYPFELLQDLSLESIIGEHDVSPAAKLSLAARVSELLTKASTHDTAHLALIISVFFCLGLKAHI